MKCAHCLYFKVTKFECHEGPPHLDFESRKAIWPRVNPSNFCGSFKSKLEADKNRLIAHGK